MSNSYYKRVLTYDDATDNYIINVPMLGIEVRGDTEVNALKHAREAIEEYCLEQSRLAKKAAETSYSEYD